MVGTPTQDALAYIKEQMALGPRANALRTVSPRTGGTGDDFILRVDLDKGDMNDILKALKTAGGKAVGREAGALRRLTARMARDAIWPGAPTRTTRRGEASFAYGPLRKRSSWTASGSMKKWGVAGPYYLNFVRAGTAGRAIKGGIVRGLHGLRGIARKSRFGPRDFIAPALARILPDILKTLREGVEDILQRHFRDRKGR